MSEHQKIRIRELTHEVERLRAEDSRARAALTHLQQKVAHGCTDAHCPICDGEAQP